MTAWIFEVFNFNSIIASNLRKKGLYRYGNWMDRFCRSIDSFVSDRVFTTFNHDVNWISGLNSFLERHADVSMTFRW